MKCSCKNNNICKICSPKYYCIHGKLKNTCPCKDEIKIKSIIKILK